MHDAVEALVHDGDTVAIEGFTHLICFAAGHEIIRQRRRDLTLCRLTPDVVYDQMIGAGVASKLVFSWLGNPGVGSLHAIRRRIEHADPAPIEIEEYSHFGMVCRYVAGASNLPFFPIRSYDESDIPKVNPNIRSMVSPYEDATEIHVVPPLKPDVAIVHAQRADASGDAQIWGLLGCQKEAAFAADRVIVVCEEMVEESVIRADPNRTVIPGRDRRCRGGGAVRVSPVVHAGVLRPRQRVLPGVGCDRPRGRLARRVARRMGLRPGEPRRVRREDGRATLGLAPAGSGHVRRGRLRAVRVSDAAATDLGYTKSEIMIAASARQLDAVRNCFVGVGLPNIVCNLAQRTVSPDLQLVYESGVFGARPERLPLSIGDPTLVTGATAVTSMFELFAYYLQAGLIDVAFLGAAQIDRFGNINTTVIGDYDHPKVRLPGSGGACEIAINARQVMVIMRQGTRSFVDTIDFRTSPGHSGDPAHDAARGWWGSGPTSVVTDLGTYAFDASTGEMTLTTLHPGVTLEQVRDNMGWEPRVADGLGETPAPSDEELRLIREELDPGGVYTK